MAHHAFGGKVLAVAAAIAAATIAPAALAADVTDIGYVDQNALATIPSFQDANRKLKAYGDGLSRQYQARAKGQSADQQQRLGVEFNQKMAEKQRELFGPLLQRAQVAVASIASSKNLSVVVDKRIVVVGGQDITQNVHDLLTGVGDPVPPVSTPPPSSVGYVDQQQIDAIPQIRKASDDLAAFKAQQDKTASQKLKDAKTDADRDAVLKDYQKTLEDKQNQVLKPWVDKTRDAIAAAAKKKNLVLVVDRGSIVFGGQDVTADVTSQIK